SGDDHPAFAGRDLLIGVEGEDGSVPERANFAASVGCADGFTCVFDDEEMVAAGNIHDGCHFGRAAKGVYDEDGAGFWSDRLLDAGGSHIQRFGVDFYEDWLGALVANGVGGSDEGEGRNDDLIAFADAECPDA